MTKAHSPTTRAAPSTPIIVRLNEGRLTWYCRRLISVIGVTCTQLVLLYKIFNTTRSTIMDPQNSWARRAGWSLELATRELADTKEQVFGLTLLC